MLLALAAGIAVGLGLSMLRPGAPPHCWEAPNDALHASTDAYWLLDDATHLPLYCVRWLGPYDPEKPGRDTLGARCWPAKPLSEAACAQRPAP